MLDFAVSNNEAEVSEISLFEVSYARACFTQ